MPLCDFSNKESLIGQSLLSNFHKEAQAFSLKTGFPYDKETAEKNDSIHKEKLNPKKVMIIHCSFIRDASYIRKH